MKIVVVKTIIQKRKKTKIVLLLVVNMIIDSGAGSMLAWRSSLKISRENYSK